MKTTKIVFTFLAVLSLTLFSCSDENVATTGKLNVQITDAPFPFDTVEEANVTITKIEGRLKEGDIEGSPFITLTEEEAQINLVELNNGLTETLANTTVPVGKYDLFRIYIKEASVLLTDGTSYEMTIPSGAQSGLKVFVKPNITVGGDAPGQVLLDFDISRSFVPQSNPNAPNGISGFNFKPVIKACNVDTTGTLRGVVTGGYGADMMEPLFGAEVSVYNAEGMIETTTFTDENGNYMVLGLDPGTYSATVVADGYPSETADDVVITTGGETVQDFELVIAAE
ncbi:DUF4382 domain-containing protein [Aquimarina brevivitae]|uniref:Carboxypeptidase family protein n=1 Tax=Aquimarina brevivitae TaxID=323412 RepID=A0A4Q7PHG2_9FLAO|nr:DUF4382 domain-containing protein [Aquimarina brevivitae]RZS99845.1 carboxypeptidase family protein [Aquimarina brevivitae]